MTTPHPLQPESWATATWPLGAHPHGNYVTFAVSSPAATRVELEFYNAATGVDAAAWCALARGEDGIWRGSLAGVQAGDLYAYRVWGPTWTFDPEWRRGDSSAGFVVDVDSLGNHFNPNKVLFDPYAREITHTRLSPQVEKAGGDFGTFGTGGTVYRDRPRREIDTGRWAPKGVIVDSKPGRTWSKPALPAEDAVIYEAHVKELTRHPSAMSLSYLLSGAEGFSSAVSIPNELRGTYAGAALMANYLAALGITTIELMPVHQTETGGDTTNAWGYMTMAYFAPNREYAFDQSPGGPTTEFQNMMRAFHSAGIEVYLDVVYNHSAEGGNWGDPGSVGFVSLGGFDTPGYYDLTSGLTLVDGATGCGNQLNYANTRTQQLVLDSLTYWIDVMGADGFRFDLAPDLGRTPVQYDRDDWSTNRQFHPDHPLLLAIRDLAHDRNIEVVAEAWDLWGYEVGNFPNGWSEWNGRYRDAIRSFLKGDANTQDFIDMMNGDYAHFADQGGPQRSINFITAHDGFTMADLVSYNDKINDQPYPFGPSDGGTDQNLSWDSGGDHRLRRQRWRNFLTVLYLSRGVPMIRSGDEYGRSQNGNNNPWCLDTPGQWNNWAEAGSNAPHRVDVDPGRPGIERHDNFGVADSDPRVNPMLAFTRFLGRLRHNHPGLRQRTYGDSVIGDDDVTYYFVSPDGQTPLNGHRCVGLLIDCGGTADDFYLAINMADRAVTFELPPVQHRPWRRILDTASFAEANGNVWDSKHALVIDGSYQVNPWSMVLLSNPSVPTRAATTPPVRPSATEASSSVPTPPESPSSGSTV